MDCSNIGYISYFGSHRVRLEYIFWRCEEGDRENWKSSRNKESYE